MQIAENVLVPALRKMSSETIVISDGCSCREQIRHGAGRWTMHPAEVLALALERDVPVQSPEEHFIEPPAAPVCGPLRAEAVAAVAPSLIFGVARSPRD